MPGQGDRIAGLIALDQAGDGRKDEPVIVAVKVFGTHSIGDLVPRRGIEHQTAEHRLLGFNGMRRQSQPIAARCVRGQRPIANASGGHVQSARRGFAGRYSSGTIVTVKITLTSVCKCSWTWCSPVKRMGPFGMRTSLREIG